jgi:beta-catenin-like protein 1
VYRLVPDWRRIDPFPQHRETNGHGGGPQRIPDHEGGRSKRESKESFSIDGIEALLQIVANFRKTQPSDEAELSTLENACMVLNAALLYSHSNLSSFLELQGIELALRCLKERVHAGGLALKWLDVGATSPPLSGPEHGALDDDSVRRRFCERAVEAGAFKFVFPIFMGRHAPKQAPAAALASSSKRARKEWSAAVDSTVISVLYGLTVRLRDDSPSDAKQRLVAKFVDADKSDRLVELCLHYDRKARQSEFNFYRDVEDSIDGGNDPSVVPVAALAAKLDGGGDVLHRACAVAAFCCVESRRCHERILSQLRVQGSGITLIREALQEFAANLADGRPQKAQIESYVERI